MRIHPENIKKNEQRLNENFPRFSSSSFFRDQRLRERFVSFRFVSFCACARCEDFSLFPKMFITLTSFFRIFQEKVRETSANHMRERQRERKKKERTHSLTHSPVKARCYIFYRICARARREKRKKRRMGERDLWDTIVNNDDICFEHILPKLNGTDVKFLFEVNGETRALIKRSSRVGELEKSFEVSEMSSISTLEFAWENQSLWLFGMNGPLFSYRVAQTNKHELLKWAREEKKCEWDDKTITKAAIQGNLEMVKYCVANECPIDEWTCAGAAYHGHLECLKCLHEEGNAPWNSFTAAWAALKGHLHILEYLVERKYDEYQENACAYAPWYGHLDCLKYLRETAKAPWDSHAVRRAHKYDRLECLQYLLDNDCPLPRGWRYEHGTLHTD